MVADAMDCRRDGLPAWRMMWPVADAMAGGMDGLPMEWIADGMDGRMDGRCMKRARESGVSYAVLYKVVVRWERNGSELTLASDQLTTT